MDGERVRADALDAGAHGDEELREVLHVRLAGGVAEHRRALRRDGGDERVLGGRDARLVEEDVGAAEPLRAQNERVVELEARAELLEREEVRVDAASADDVAARRGQLDLAAAREQRAREQDRGADLPAERRVELGRPQLLRVDRERVAGRPLGAGADGLDELDERLDVADARDVLEVHRVLAEERRGDDRQRGVLVAGGADAAGERVPALDDELLCAHGSGAMDGRIPSRPELGKPGNIPGVRRSVKRRRRRRRVSAQALHPSRRDPLGSPLRTA